MNYKTFLSAFFILLELQSIYPQDSRENLFLGKYPIPANTSDPINIDTSKAHPVDLSPLILSANGETPVTLENTGRIVQALPQYYDPRHYLTGGPLGKNRYRYWSDRIYWTDNPDGIEGATMDHIGAPIEYRVFFLNNKYSEAEALNETDGVAALLFLTPLCKNKTSKAFLPLFNAIRKIQAAGSKVNVKLSALLQANYGAKRSTKYYAYPGPYADQNGNTYFCATILAFPITKQKCVSRKQLLQSVGLLKNSLDNDLGISIHNIMLQCQLCRHKECAKKSDSFPEAPEASFELALECYA